MKILIKDTTRKEREEIIRRALDCGVDDILEFTPEHGEEI